MTTERDLAVVLKDAAGDYFLVPLETVERGRVAAADRAAVERAIEASLAATGGDDVRGHRGDQYERPGGHGRSGTSFGLLANDGTAASIYAMVIRVGTGFGATPPT